ncbi:MAG: nuclear transport factor 2 family protein [Anaerolineae bacterium]|nr:nuclear transport factor 2 family protein [Phycisphaerae bacterium]
MRTTIFGSILLIALVTGCRTIARTPVDQTLDRFHAAAARADEKIYFDCFAPEGVFLGTDATERWDVPSFRAFAHPYFSQGKGWTYTSSDRHIAMAPSNDLAWFDEMLQNDKLGTCRGSGVLRLINGEWKIAQYNLSIPIPNDHAKTVVEMIRTAAATQKTK